MDTSHETLLPYRPEWAHKYAQEEEALKKILGGTDAKIEHIGSTAIPGLASKAIIDIAVLLHERDADRLVGQLRKLGYVFDEKAHAMGTSPERHFFRKGTPTTFHLSLAYSDRGSFWKRQMLFRDFLRAHPEVRDEYQTIKESAMKNDSTGGTAYIPSKTAFVNKVLEKAGFVRWW